MQPIIAELVDERKITERNARQGALDKCRYRPTIGYKFTAVFLHV